jgi:hypothetical protein
LQLWRILKSNLHQFRPRSLSRVDIHQSDGHCKKKRRRGRKKKKFLLGRLPPQTLEAIGK